MRKRVVVTGLGVVSPSGCTKTDLWTNVCNGISYGSKLVFDDFEKLPSKVAATVSPDKFANLLEQSGFTESKMRTMAKSTFFAMVAAEQAVTDARLKDCDSNLKQNIGVAVGSGMSDFGDICDADDNLRKSYNRLNPYFIPRILLNMAAGQISMAYGFQGPNHCVSTACATGVHAIGDSYRLISSGFATAMICGGTEACVNPLTIAGFCRIRALSTKFNDSPQKASRPFDANRDGFVIGEGAAILVLEELDHAVQRKANIYAEILGYGMSGDAAHLTSPHEDGTGAILCMKRAMADAVVDCDQISYINAHATSTPMGDDIELHAIGEIFQKSNRPIYVSSTKGCHGHLLGAAGSIESLCTVLSCFNGVIPPTANLEECSPHSPSLECNTVQQTWNNDRRIALKNSFGFGGTNATICIANFTS